MAQLRLYRKPGAVADCGHGTGRRGVMVTGPVAVQVPCTSCIYGYAGCPVCGGRSSWACPACRGVPILCEDCNGEGVLVTEEMRTFCAPCAVRKYQIVIRDAG